MFMTRQCIATTTVSISYVDPLHWTTFSIFGVDTNKRLIIIIVHRLRLSILYCQWNQSICLCCVWRSTIKTDSAIENWFFFLSIYLEYEKLVLGSVSSLNACSWSEDSLSIELPGQHNPVASNERWHGMHCHANQIKYYYIYSILYGSLSSIIDGALMNNNIKQ